MYEFARLLKRFRVDAGLSQSELAAEVGRGRTTISAWERGLNLPEDRKIVMKVAAVLGLSHDESNELLVAAEYPPAPQFHRTRGTPLTDGLVAGLERLPTDYATRIENFLQEYLGSAGVPVPFGGREAEIARLNAWLRDPTAPPRALMIAEAGRGKGSMSNRV